MPQTRPLACSLPADRLRAERDLLLPGLVRHARTVTPLPDGMRFTFPATAERLRQLHEVTRREAECCEFLELRPGFTPGGAFLQLDVTGPEGTRELLEQVLELAVAA